MYRRYVGYITEAAPGICAADGHWHPSRRTPSTESTTLVGDIPHRGRHRHDDPRCEWAELDVRVAPNSSTLSWPRKGHGYTEK